MAAHVFIAGRCVHCDTDNHSLPERGEELADWQKPCPVPFEERQTRWIFETPTGSGIRAQWAGRCPGCGDVFKPGAPIRAFGSGLWGHAGCRTGASLGADDIADFPAGNLP